MKILTEILKTLPDGEILDVRIGLHWTAVVAQVSGEQRCGLASTLSGDHDHHGEPDVPQAGQLKALSGRDLAAFSLLEKPTLASVGLAALNALLPRASQNLLEANAEQMIARYGQGRRVVMIGHFPFTDRLRSQVGELLVLEQTPRPGDLPAEAAPRVMPTAHVAAITGMTLSNHTLEGLLELCSPQAFVIVMGPSTPLSPLLFRYGVDMISGSLVTEIEPVLQCVSQGGNFRQVHRAGVRLVNMARPGNIDKEVE